MTGKPATKKLTTPKRTINLRVDTEAYEKIRGYADRNQRTVSWVINTILTKAATNM
jgi:hypothetical protein